MIKVIRKLFSRIGKMLTPGPYKSRWDRLNVDSQSDALGYQNRSGL